MHGPTKPPSYLKEHERSLNPNMSEWSIYNSHDPSIFHDGDTYYILSTDTKTSLLTTEMKSGAQIRKSKNLIDWKWVGHALDGVPKEAFEWTGARGLWAPEVVKWENTYYLYYCASQFGTNQSFIGVATSNSMEGPWQDQGEVFKTTKTDEPNAIDPNLITDRNGNRYLIYGSFFSGIYAARLNHDTGKLLEYGEGVCIARREHETKEGAIEGPYMVYHPDHDMYYLFVSYDSLFSNYNIRVGRSREVTGPFVDFHGNDLKDIDYRPSDEIGTKLLAGYQFSDGSGWMAPGHNSILEQDGAYFIVHHARLLDKKDTFCLHVRRILWTEDGWPIISPERYAGEKIESIDEIQMIGSWDAIKFDRLVQGVNQAFPVKFLPGNICLINNQDYTWRKVDNYTIYVNEKNTSDKMIELKVLKAWDWELDRETIVFTGMDTTGTCIIGKKLE
ncbi:arabinan endo-1,5-alpha-L-arabinosidase [Anaerobacillus alkaliphilus]|uniref:Arabinan endo-1,5-alpha-L-arabinosidase n=1 Tax=Anaerobacillus alkaliphilus TaxID=1548597 RepID=A0A4Q0VM37_9BACI|nr:arabinan endo-1,5-alpha-L-arabinosidase [Anaerobacillus alkaliphilus]RXI96253.1 arabinan endo-1,5-alpha-L-arabinosidase [Anaerobacillus alkaliphilus]